MDVRGCRPRGQWIRILIGTTIKIVGSVNYPVGICVRCCPIVPPVALGAIVPCVQTRTVIITLGCLSYNVPAIASNGVVMECRRTNGCEVNGIVTVIRNSVVGNDVRVGILKIETISSAVS